MDKENILEYLNKNDMKHGDLLKNFALTTESLYSRKNEFGHLTASAFILSHDLKNVLLIHHAKYDIWLSPGGHVDEGENILQALIREAQEETGAHDLKLLYNKILDIDGHKIPYSAKNNEAEHWHFDVRYLLKAPKDMSIDLNTVECKGFQWVSLESLKTSNDESLKRQAHKVEKIIINLEKKNSIKNKM